MKNIAFPLLLDGAAGTQLIKYGMPAGVCAEQWLCERPEVQKSVHLSYINAGAGAIYSPTFGANRFSLAKFGLSDRVAEINRALCRTAREVCTEAGKSTLLFGDMSPTGKFILPFGDTPFDDVAECYSEQAEALYPYVDGYIVETMFSLSETRCAVCGIRDMFRKNRVAEKPIFCTVTLEKSGRTMAGDTLLSSLFALSALGVTAFGMNCSTGPRDACENILPLLPYAYDLGMKIVLKPNSGAPGEEPLSPDGFADAMERALAGGIEAVGGCCGTDSEYIGKLQKKLASFRPYSGKTEDTALVAASASEICRIGADTDAVSLDEAEDMGDDLGFAHVAVSSLADAEDLIDATAYLRCPLAVTCTRETADYLSRYYCGRLIMNVK